jgi:hypothetical protein
METVYRYEMESESSAHETLKHVEQLRLKRTIK